MAEKIRKEFILDAAACDEISELVFDRCISNGTERKDALRYRLSAEECLLYWLRNGCGGKRVVVSMGRFMLTPYITIEAEGSSLDPYSEDDADFGSFCDSILVSMRLSPEYSYNNGYNCIKFRLRRKSPGQIVTLCLVILSAALVGMLGHVILPGHVREVLLTSVVDPVYNTFFNILGCIAGPMIFLSVSWGVYGIGDVSTLGRIGKKMMLRFVGTVMIAAACSTVFFPALGPGLSSGSEAGGQFASVSELILGIFPSTIVEPFATGNTLQIIFLAIVIGIALLYLGKQTSSVARAIEQVNLLVQFLMEIISKLVPYVIFLVIINMIWSGSIDVLISSWRLVLVLVVACVAAAAVFLILTSVSRKVSVPVLIRKSTPTFLVALTTASSAAAFSSNVTTCEKRFGIDESLIRFGIPLGMVMHKPISAIYNLLILFFFAAKYDIGCSIGWICVAVFISAVIAIATPPIPGGGAVAYSILFAQMGIPSEALAVALALDLITDFLITAFEMLVLPLSLINVSAGLGMINEDVLRSEDA